MAKIEVRARVPSLKSYKGFLVEALVNDASLTSLYREDLMKIIPGQVDYDEYVGAVAIMNSAQTKLQKEDQMKILFKHKEKIVVGTRVGRRPR